MTIEFITHLSYEHPLLMKEFLNGLKSTPKDSVEVKTHFIGADIGNRDFIEKVQTITIEQEADLLVIYSSTYKLDTVTDLLEKLEIKTLFITGGFYNHIFDKTEVKANISSLSLEMAECNYHLGAYANKNFKGQLGIISDFINSGYQGGFYLTAGYEKTFDEVLFQQIIQPTTPKEQYLQTMKQQLLAARPAVLFLNTGSTIGKTILQLREDADITEAMPSLKWLIGDELLMELMKNGEEVEENMIGCSTLVPYSKMEDRWQSQMKGKRSPFFALGYEALVIAKQIVGEDQKAFEGPRGNIEWLPKERSYKAQPKVITKNNDKLVIQKVEQVEEYPILKGYGGWQNAYLCY